MMVLKAARRFRRDDRAQLSSLQVMIFVFVVSVVLAIVAYNIYHYILSRDVVQKCSMSIVAADSMVEVKRNSATAVDFVPDLSCDMQEIELVVDDVVRTKGGRIDDEMFKQFFADQMMSCFSMVGSGKMLPFDHVNVEMDKSYCLLCAKVMLSDYLKKKIIDEKYGIYGSVSSQSGFMYYLSKKRLPKGDMSYYEALYRSMPSAETMFLAKGYAFPGNEIPFLQIDPPAFTDVYIVWRTSLNRPSKIWSNYVYLMNVNDMSAETFMKNPKGVNDVGIPCTTMLN
jgi:hypothetical protein